MAVSKLLGTLGIILFAGFFLFGIYNAYNTAKTDDAIKDHCASQPQDCAVGLAMMTIGKGAINPPYYQSDWLPEAVNPKNEVVQYNNQSVQVYYPILEDGFSFDSTDLIILIPLLLFMIWLFPKIQLNTWTKIFLFILILFAVFVCIKVFQYELMLWGGDKVGFTHDQTRAWRQLEVEKVGGNAVWLLLLGVLTSYAFAKGVLGWFGK